MENSKIKDFLHKIHKENKITLLKKYIDFLLEENKKINLISRKVTEKEMWEKHIYDSILPTQFYNFSESTILDFGTGGGLPGLPIKILYPTAKIYFVDSIKKKIKALKNICTGLFLNNCYFLDDRIENINFTNKFDYILSRSVKMNENYIKILRKMLKENGKVILYKTENMEDFLKNISSKIIDVSDDILKSRLLVEIRKNDKNNICC